MSAIAKAVEIVGSHTAIAQILGVKQAHVCNWINTHQHSPANYIRRICLATKGRCSETGLLKDHEL
ncbi:transcriptional regulator [Marinomonas rhizomae]|uniref:YdaS family helix-turn-helix protein n=1 Tax=Marinomonas rhizomae TaxID=491948 RepID=UPI000DE8887A|nr:YdaS family helix-turn-helix protein [Marinomonas rhizomae]RNF70422.1 transcriptional regulator [Marinomonas rhizomae]